MRDLPTLKLQRSVATWAKCDPKAMAVQSESAVFYALKDAREDILVLAQALRVVAYPRRGTAEDFLDITTAAEFIQKLLTFDDVGEL